MDLKKKSFSRTISFFMYRRSIELCFISSARTALLGKYPNGLL